MAEPLKLAWVWAVWVRQGVLLGWPYSTRAAVTTLLLSAEHCSSELMLHCSDLKQIPFSAAETAARPLHASLQT
jgi:hypothetical protein